MKYLIGYVFIGLVLAGLFGVPKVKETVEEQAEKKVLSESERDTAMVVVTFFMVVLSVLFWPMIVGSGIRKLFTKKKQA